MPMKNYTVSAPTKMSKFLDNTPFYTLALLERGKN